MLLRQHKWKPGDHAIYDMGDPLYDLYLRVHIVREVEGWYEISCADGSTAIVRPSHLSPIPRGLLG